MVHMVRAAVVSAHVMRKVRHHQHAITSMVRRVNACRTTPDNYARHVRRVTLSMHKNMI